MPTNFKPVCTINAAIAKHLMRIEAAQGVSVTEKIIQTLHALVMSDGRTRVKPTPYRDGQNVIKDSGTGTIMEEPLGW